MNTVKKGGAGALALAIALASSHEGIKFTPYYDPPGILTVCRGHTGKDVVKDRKYTLAQCDAFMDQDMRVALAAVDRCQPGLPEEVRAAFADTVFNGGPRIACDRTNSTAARLLDARDFVGACNQLPRWNKARIAGVLTELPGLTKRRTEARDLCLEGTEQKGA